MNRTNNPRSEPTLVDYMTIRRGRINTFLTRTHVCQKRKRLGSEERLHIPLHHVTSVRIYRKTPWLLIIAALFSLVLAIICLLEPHLAWVQDPESFYPVARGILFTLSIVFLLLFFVGRKHGFSITSPTAKIAINIGVFGRTRVLDFADEVVRRQRLLVKGWSSTRMRDGEQLGEFVTWT